MAIEDVMHATVTPSTREEEGRDQPHPRLAFNKHTLLHPAPQINPNSFLKIRAIHVKKKSVSIRVNPWLNSVRKMKSAYELAMERLNKTAPTVKLTAAQKKNLAELDSKYAAKVAEREIALKGEMDKAAESGNAEAFQQLQRQLSDDKRKLQSELEDKKDRIRKPA